MSKGKQFESKFAEDIRKRFKTGTLIRLPDQISGYKYSSANICDFLLYNYPNFYFIECKSHLGNTFPLANLTQYDKLKEKVGIPGVRAGVILWMIDHDVVVYLPISTVTKMKDDGRKSFNVKMLEEKTYNIKVMPSVKKRVFLDTDYSSLTQLKDGE